LVRYLVSALVAVLTLFVTFFALTKAIGPGSPAEVLIVGELELIAAKLAEFPVPPEPERRPPERPRFEPDTGEPLP
jgi:hypothetical protein